MSINKLKIMYNTNTRKYLRQATEDWKRSIIKSSGNTCFITGKKQKNGNQVILTAHHVSRTYNSIVREAHHNLNLPYHEVTTEYKPGELPALLEEIKRLHQGIEGICLTKEAHDALHRNYGKNATMDDVREMKRNYRRINHQNRNGVYKSKRSA
jgi:hypothetical protein